MGFFNPPVDTFLTSSLTSKFFPLHLQLFSLQFVSWLVFTSPQEPAKAQTVRVESLAGGTLLIHCDAKLSASAFLTDYLFSLGKQAVWGLATFKLNDKHLIPMQLLHGKNTSETFFWRADNCHLLAHNRQNIISDLGIRWGFPQM